MVSLALAAVLAGSLQTSELNELAELRGAYEASPSDPAVALALAARLARAGVTHEALEILKHARELDPTAAEAYLVTALVLRDEARQREGADVLEQALARGIGDVAIYEELGFLLLSLGDRERARAVAAEGLDHYPESARLAMVLGLSLTGNAENAERAAALLTQALHGGAPDPARLHREIGTILVSLGHNEEGLGHLERAVELNPDSAEANFRLGTALRTTGDLEGAREALARFQELQRREEASDVEERSLRTELNEAQRLALSNRLLESLEKLDAIASGHPEDPRAYVLRAKVLSSLGRDAEALASLLAARGMGPATVESFLLEGRFLLKLGRFEAARTALDHAVTLDSTLTEAYELLGVASANLGQHEVAVDHFERALALGSDSGGLYLNLAESLRKLGRHADAERALEASRAR